MRHSPTRGEPHKGAIIRVEHVGATTRGNHEFWTRAAGCANGSETRHVPERRHRDKAGLSCLLLMLMIMG